MGFSLDSCEASAAARLVNEEHGKGLISNGLPEVRGLHRHPFARRVGPEDRVGLVVSREYPYGIPFLKGRPIGATVTIPRGRKTKRAKVMKV